MTGVAMNCIMSSANSSDEDGGSQSDNFFGGLAVAEKYGWGELSVVGNPNTFPPPDSLGVQSILVKIK